MGVAQVWVGRNQKFLQRQHRQLLRKLPAVEFTQVCHLLNRNDGNFCGMLWKTSGILYIEDSYTKQSGWHTELCLLAQLETQFPRPQMPQLRSKTGLQILSSISLLSPPSLLPFLILFPQRLLLCTNRLGLYEPNQCTNWGCPKPDLN